MIAKLLRIKPNSLTTKLSRTYILRKPVEYDDSQDLRYFYEVLIDKNEYTTKGYMNPNPEDFRFMIRRSQNEEDIDLCLEAFYNFTGHKHQFLNKDVDEFVLKAVELDCAEKMFDIFKYHQYISYFPHPLITSSLLASVFEKDDIESFKKLTSIFSKNSLIKLDTSSKKTLSDVLDKVKNEDLEAEIELIHNRISQ